MKRIVAIIITLVVVLGGYLGFSRAQQKRRPVVGVLTMMHHPALDQIYKGFVAGLAAEGYHNGKNIKIEYQNANGDQSSLNQMANKLINDHAKVVMGITTPAAQSLANATKSTPVLMGGIGDPVGSRLVKSMKHPGGNVTGVQSDNPVRQQLTLAKRFLPHAKQLGLIYTSSDPSAEHQAKQMEAAAKQLNIKLRVATIANSNDLNQVSQSLLTYVDGVMVPCDNTIAGSMKVLVKNADTVNKPVFPGADTMVKDGGVASISLDQYGMGKATGKMAAQILKGKRPQGMAVDDYHHGKPVLNLKQVHKLGLKVPAGFTKDAQQHGQVIK
jgi:putative ABC transport system substrate-binding protein